MPKSVLPKVKANLHEIWMAETRKEAEKTFDHFAEKYGAKYDKAVACVAKDCDGLLAFHDFPAHLNH